MKSFKNCFQLAPVAWLMSYCLWSGLDSGLVMADERPILHSATTVRSEVTTNPAAGTVNANRRMATNYNDRNSDQLSFRSVTSSGAIVNHQAAPGAKPAATKRVVNTAPDSGRHDNGLLNFTPTTAGSIASTQTKPDARASRAPAPEKALSIVKQQVHSVSALSLAALPPRLAARRGEGKVILGPSEAELRQVFNRAVEAAVERAPAIFRARAEQQAAEEDIAEAKGQRWPQVEVGTQTSPVKFGKGSDQESGSGGINVAVTTPLYDWGRIRNSIDSRKHLSKAADESLEAEKESLGYEVVTTMVELGKQRIIVDLSQQFADRMSDLVKMLAGIVAVDRGRSSELTQAKARLLQAQALRDSANAKARDAEIALRKLVGERPVPIPRSKEWNIRLANLDLLLSDAEEHPTIRQATAEAESAELQAKAVRASGLPQLNWVVSKSTAEDSLGREQPWQTNLSVTWGAFRGGSTRAAERAALQRAEASRYEIDDQRRDLEFRIRTADHDARTMLERSELYRELSTESARIREDFFQQWHHLGRRTLLDVLTAENEHYGNQVNEIINRFDGYQAIMRQYAGAGTLARWLRTGS